MESESGDMDINVNALLSVSVNRTVFVLDSQTFDFLGEKKYQRKVMKVSIQDMYLIVLLEDGHVQCLNRNYPFEEVLILKQNEMFLDAMMLNDTFLCGVTRYGYRSFVCLDTGLFVARVNFSTSGWWM